MASDEDTRRWEDAQRARWDKFAQETARTDQLNEALRKKDFDTAGYLMGIPPAEAGSRSGPPPAPRVPTIGEQYRQHREALLFHLRYARALPNSLTQRWTEQVEALVFEEPEAGLPVITEIWEEYQQLSQDPPPARDMSRRVQWDEQMPGIGDEIWWVMRIVRHLLTPEF